MKIIIHLAAVLSLLLSVGSAFAGGGAGGILVYRFGPKGAVTGLDGVINLDPILEKDHATACTYRMAQLTIDSVVYDGVSEIVAGFRTSNDDLYRVFPEDLYKNVSNAQRHLIRDLFKKGQRVLVSYSACGSGGYVYIREIFKASAIQNAPSAR